MSLANLESVRHVDVRSAGVCQLIAPSFQIAPIEFIRWGDYACFLRAESLKGLHSGAQGQQIRASARICATLGS